MAVHQNINIGKERAIAYHFDSKKVKCGRFIMSESMPKRPQTQEA
jgi:hypothetical protein